MSDQLRGLIMAVVTSLLNGLVVLHLVNLEADGLGAINLAIGNIVLLVAYFWKAKPTA